MKKKTLFTVLAILLVVAALAWAGAVTIKPYGIATPYWYGYSAGAKTTYYLQQPTLTANDYVMTLATAQSVTGQKTYTYRPLLVSGSLAYTTGGGTTVAADALAIPVTHAYVAKTTGADAEALTLADGTAGQVITIDLDTDGTGDGTLSPTTCSGFTSIVFADAGDNATLMYIDDTVGWIILGLAGVAAPPVTVD